MSEDETCYWDESPVCRHGIFEDELCELCLEDRDMIWI